MARSVGAFLAFMAVSLGGRLCFAFFGVGVDLTLGDTLAVSIPSILATFAYVAVNRGV